MMSPLLRYLDNLRSRRFNGIRRWSVGERSRAARCLHQAGFTVLALLLGGAAQTQETTKLSPAYAEIIKQPYDQNLPSLAPCFSSERKTEALVKLLEQLGWKNFPKQDIQANFVAALGWERYVSQINAPASARFSVEQEMLIQGVRYALGASKAPDVVDQQTRFLANAQGSTMLLVNRVKDGVLLCKVAYSAQPTESLMVLAEQIQDADYPTSPQVHALDLPNQQIGGTTRFARITHLSREAWQMSAPNLAIPTAFVSAGRALSPESK